MLLETPQVDLDWQAPSFDLADANGKTYSLDKLMGEKGLVVAFICNHCPYVIAIIERFVQDSIVLKEQGINTVAIMSNDYKYVSEDSPENMLRFAKKHNFNFPYLIDQDQSVAKAYDAVCTPDFFGFNETGKLQYRGRLDDVKMKNVDNRKPELLDAMTQIAKTGESMSEQFPSMGCSIKWS